MPVQISSTKKKDSETKIRQQKVGNLPIIFWLMIQPMFFLIKAGNRKRKTIWEIYSKSPIKTPERRRSGAFIKFWTDFAHCSDVFNVNSAQGNTGWIFMQNGADFRYLKTIVYQPVNWFSIQVNESFHFIKNH